VNEEALAHWMGGCPENKTNKEARRKSISCIIYTEGRRNGLVTSYEGNVF
jgi:hypothetical protein